ncbi:hypothetical protein Tco_1407049 [Tanacetum coccineum]
MAREAEVKKQRVFNTGNGVAKPVWTNANRVNHSNKFVPRSVQLNTGLELMLVVQMLILLDSDKPREIGDLLLRPSAGYNWKDLSPNSNCDMDQLLLRTVNAKGSFLLKSMGLDRVSLIVDAQGHMKVPLSNAQEVDSLGGKRISSKTTAVNGECLLLMLVKKVKKCGRYFEEKKYVFSDSEEERILRSRGGKSKDDPSSFLCGTRAGYSLKDYCQHLGEEQVEA